MSPAAGVVSLDVARLAVDVQAIKGELALVTSTVGQQVATLTTLVHEIQAEQLRSREDRLHQLALLTSLSERASGITGSDRRLQELESRVGYWRGVFVGFGALATVILGMSVAWITNQFESNAHERGRLEARIERLERRP